MSTLEDLRLSLGGRAVSAEVFGFDRDGRKFGVTRVAVEGRAFLVVETLVGRAADGARLMSLPRLPIGAIELRDGRAFLHHALPETCDRADVDAIVAELARAANALAIAQRDGAVAAYAHLAG